jgi:DNA-directed RNA polymerase sigma subunit (sigma70/sigma32)
MTTRTKQKIGDIISFRLNDAEKKMVARNMRFFTSSVSAFSKRAFLEWIEDLEDYNDATEILKHNNPKENKTLEEVAKKFGVKLK